MRTPTPLVVFLLLGLFASAGCTHHMHFKKQNLHGHFRSAEYQFCIKVPDKWEIRQRLQGATVVCLSPLAGKQDTFRENLVVTATKLSDHPTDRQYRTQLLKALAAAGDKVTNLQQGMGPQLPWASYVHSPHGRKIAVLAYFKVNQVNGTPYGLVFAFSTDQVKNFAPKEKMFRSIAKTFKFGANCPKLATTPSPKASPTPAKARPTHAKATPTPAKANPAISASPPPSKAAPKASPTASPKQKPTK